MYTLVFVVLLANGQTFQHSFAGFADEASCNFAKTKLPNLITQTARSAKLKSFNCVKAEK